MSRILNRFSLLALLLLTVSGFVWLEQPTYLPPLIPLSQLPADLLGPGWDEKDKPLGEGEIKTLLVSDYLRREYSLGSFRFTLYVGYYQRRAGGVLHHPETCFPNFGYELESQKRLEGHNRDFYEIIWLEPEQWVHSAQKVQLYCQYSFFYNDDFCPDEELIRAADRSSRLPYYVLVLLTGSNLEDQASTRARYEGFLNRILPALMKHFPRSHPKT